MMNNSKIHIVIVISNEERNRMIAQHRPIKHVPPEEPSSCSAIGLYNIQAFVTELQTSLPLQKNNRLHAQHEEIQWRENSFNVMKSIGGEILLELVL